MNRDLIAAIREAWAKLGPVLVNDPDELAHRQARRRKDFMLHPHRAWCLAVRASDSRITPWHFPMVPDKPTWWDATHHCWRHVEHEVILRAQELRWLCRPVSIPRPGVQWTEAAKMLGVDPMAIRAAINRGLFSVRHIPHLGGKPGRAIPVVYTKELLDPASYPLGNAPGPEWGTTWRFLSDHLPDELSQTLLRRPVYRPFRGQPKFRGWRWICPGCQRETLRVFYPLPPLTLTQFAHLAPTPHDPQAPLPCFACARCHRINDEGRLRAQGWDTLIAHLTNGLLYGREVKKPSWYTPTRKRKFLSRPALPRSKSQAQVLEFLLTTDLNAKQIARTLRFNPNSVQVWIHRIYQRYNVRSREQLRQTVAASQPQAARSAG